MVRPRAPATGRAFGMDEAQAGAGFSHCALIYQDVPDGVAAVLAFVRDGVARGEPVALAVCGPTARLLRGALGDGHPGVEFHEMSELGRNPGRIMSAASDFAGRHPGQAVRWLEEPVWPGRSPAEVTEAIRHEALVNLAFRVMPVSVMCLYDLMRLSPALATCAEQTHPVVSVGGHTQVSGGYLGPGVLPRESDWPLPKEPAGATRLFYSADLRPVREAVASQAAKAGLARGRAADLMIAVSEVAANTVQHTPDGGWLRIWHTDDEIVCQVRDHGTIDDPLVGRRRPDQASDGYGLWVVNQICDLVELRSASGGTIVRLHMLL
jgi:anti-sigma regulatory factor (Ser/Thr protein kinase)